MNGFEQMKLVYDYIKFHLGLYLATPPVFVIIAESFEVKTAPLFQIGLVGMIVIFGSSGTVEPFAEKPNGGMLEVIE